MSSSPTTKATKKKHKHIPYRGIIPPPPHLKIAPRPPPPPLYPQCVLGIKNTTPLFFAKPPLKSAICSSPLLLGNYPLYIGSSSTPPKNQIFQ